ncbi:MAG: AtpZ/AtpI family protein [SAR202 cluster bacterium]|nr:AtpZ/AtpI family protein [SAR202 cluster bacterium]
MNDRKNGFVLRLLGIGWYVAICIAGGAFAGFGLDRWLDTGPWLTIVGVLLGVMVAVVGMYTMLLKLLESTRGDRKTR